MKSPASRKEAALRNECHSRVATGATSNPDGIHEKAYDNCQTYVHFDPTVNLDEGGSSFIPKKSEGGFLAEMGKMRNGFAEESFWGWM